MKKVVSNAFWIIVIVLVLGYFIGDRIPSLNKITQPSYNGTYESVRGKSILILKDGKAFYYYFQDDNSYHEYAEGTYYPEDNEIKWDNGRIKASSYDLVFAIIDVNVYDPYTSLEISESGAKIEAQILDFGFKTSISEMESGVDVHNAEHIDGSTNNCTFTKISDSTDISTYEDMMDVVSEKQSDDGYYWITEDESSDSESTDGESLTPAPKGGFDL